MAGKARIQRYIPDVTTSHFCEYNRADNKIPAFVFTGPDGVDHYVCEVHTNVHMEKQPEVWFALALDLAIRT
jgi:hypothetical protein